MSMGYAQTLTVKTYGFSPRDAARDTLITPKYFDRPYNGLQNVGVETKVYLIGQKSEKFTTPVWTFLSKPSGSSVAFGATRDLDTSKQVINFIPDKIGTYNVVITDGTLADTIIINAAMYLGIDGGTVTCRMCHNNANIIGGYSVDKWEQTGHATMLVRGLNGTLSDHYASYCIECHTTGYDPNAVNNGFDDWPFTFPTVLQAGMYDSMMVAYPKAMGLANIQCESCHGPGGNHYGTKSNSKMVKTLSADNCAWCHDDGTHHFFPEQWDHSQHANPKYASYAGGRAECAPCHSGSGFVEYIKGGKQALTSAPAVEAITCAVCHDPHDATNLHQLRTLSTSLGDGTAVTTGGTGVLCMNCHKSRRDAVAYTNDYLNNLSTHYGPHHGPQADMLLAKNAITFGMSLPTSPHLAATKNACVDCHMAPNGANPDGTINLAGSHTFSMTYPNGDDNVAACLQCHANFGTKFSDKKFYVNGNADLDQNGTADGLQVEIQGLLDRLAKLLPPVGSTTVNPINDSTLTLVVAQAYYNWDFVKEDRSLGVHNPAFAYSLLAATIQQLDGTTGIELIDNSVPDSYILTQNYPNPFNPTTQIKFSIPEETSVKLLIYDVLGREVSQLVNQVMQAGTYSYSWDATGNSSGIYFYKLQTDKFVKVKKMMLLK